MPLTEPQIDRATSFFKDNELICPPDSAGISYRLRGFYPEINTCEKFVMIFVLTNSLIGLLTKPHLGSHSFTAVGSF